MVSQYFVLTNKEVLVVSLDHNASCCSGLCKTGDQVKTISLDKITGVDTDGTGKGLINMCAGDMSVMVITSTTTSNGGMAVSNGGPRVMMPAGQMFGADEEFDMKGKIMDAKDALEMSYRNQLGGNGGGVPTQTMNRNDGKSVMDRIKDLKELLDNGLIEQDDFDKQKAEILTSV